MLLTPTVSVTKYGYYALYSVSYVMHEIFCVVKWSVLWFCLDASE